MSPLTWLCPIRLPFPGVPFLTKRKWYLRSRLQLLRGKLVLVSGGRKDGLLLLPQQLNKGALDTIWSLRTC